MSITYSRTRATVAWPVAVVAALVVTQGRLLDVDASAQPGNDAPVPIRNDVARPLGPDDELLMLRHHRLRKGAHEPFFKLSEIGVWPWFARIGARMTGQWVVVDPEGGDLEYDDVYRLARYASFER